MKIIEFYFHFSGGTFFHYIRYLILAVFIVGNISTLASAQIAVWKAGRRPPQPFLKIKKSP